MGFFVTRPLRLLYIVALVLRRDASFCPRVLSHCSTYHNSNYISKIWRTWEHYTATVQPVACMKITKTHFKFHLFVTHIIISLVKAVVYLRHVGDPDGADFMRQSWITQSSNHSADESLLPVAFHKITQKLQKNYTKTIRSTKSHSSKKINPGTSSTHPQHALHHSQSNLGSEDWQGLGCLANLSWSQVR